jgi:hypothetical protein
VRSTDPFLQAAFNGSFTLRTYLDAWYDGRNTAEGLDIIDGSIEYDFDADVRERLTVSVASVDGSHVPQHPEDALACFGQELHVSMSVQAVGFESSDPVSVGWYGIQNSDAEERWLTTASGAFRHGGATITVEGLDRMQRLAEYPFLVPSQPTVGATVVSEIKRLTEGLVPVGELDLALVDASVPTSTVYEGDRVPGLQGLARLIGGNLMMDAFGTMSIRKPTAYGATPVWTFRCGATGSIVAYSWGMSRDGVINAVVATGETDADHAPVAGTVVDSDSTSPTYWDGPFGRRPLGFASPLFTTAARARTGAATRLANYRRGREREVTLSVPVNFLLELDDPVTVELPDRSFDGRIVKMTLPLRPGPMTVTVRALDSSLTGVVT